MRGVLVILFWFCSLQLAWAQVDTIHYVNIGGLSAEEAIQMEALTDSTLLVLVNSGEDGGTNDAGIHLLELDADGNVLYAMSVGTYATDQATSMAIQGNLVVIAGRSNGNAGSYEGCLYFVDWSQKTLIKEVYRSLEGNWSVYTSLVAWGDSVVAVLETSLGLGMPRFEIFDLSGSLTGSQQLDSLEGHRIHKLTTLRHDQMRFVLIGESEENGDIDAVIAALDPTLNLGWYASIALPGQEAFFDVGQLSDSSLVVVGYSSSYNEEDEDILFAKYSKDGLPIDTTRRGYDVTVDNKDDQGLALAIGDSLIYFSGYMNTFGAGGKDAFLSYVDFDLNFIAPSTTQGTSKEEYTSSMLCFDDAVLGVGLTTFQAGGKSDALFWRRDSITFGSSTSLIHSIIGYQVDEVILGVDDPRDTSGLSFSVRGANDALQIFSLDRLDRTIYVLDASGRIVCEERLSGMGELVIKLPSGLYLVSQSGKHDQAVKVVVL